jgi:MFS family permease
MESRSPCTIARGERRSLAFVRRRGLWSLAWQATLDLFDQTTAFGRLAMVHVMMMAGDTMVTISLAGSLFFSVSPTEAKSKVLAYLLLTIAPFAVVSPLLGPLIDRSSNGRRFIVAFSAFARVVLCILMSRNLNSLLLFPEAFLVLVASKLYVVTRGALVPEMARADRSNDTLDQAGWPSHETNTERGFAGYNAQLTLLGTAVGIVGGLIGVGVLKSIGATSVLVTASILFVGATVAGLRLRRVAPVERSRTTTMSPVERDLHALRPHGDVEVSWGLVATAVVRFAVGFETFLLAFELRRTNAPQWYFALALVFSAVGALAGLGVVTRVRDRLAESTLLSLALLAIGLGSLLTARYASDVTQVVLAAWIGAAAAVAQPSFDAITQRNIPESAQGRTFARFAVRQQLLWVIGATIPVAIAMNFAAGDLAVAVLTLLAALGYGFGRRFAR